MSDKDQSPAAEIFEKFKEAIDKAKKFWKTKKAIEQGIQLYTWSNDEITAAKYYGPWKFNAIETAFTGGVAAGISNALKFILDIPDNKPKIELGSASPEFMQMFQKTTDWVSPFLFPILTTAIVFIIAWGSLKSKDSTPTSRKQARSAYLYFDGAFAFYSQLILAASSSFVISLIPLIDNSEKFGNRKIIFVVFLIVAVFAFFFQLYISLNKIPKLLFQANGYSGELRHIWQKTLPESPPSNRYTFANIIGGWPLFAVVTISLSLLARGLAYLLLWVKGIFS